MQPFEIDSWRPSLFIKFSVAIHVISVLTMVLRWDLWAIAVGIIVVNHVALSAAGLWPRCQLLGPNLVKLSKAAAQRGEVAITIDDGPDPEVTPLVLAILAEHSARASFFCIGDRAIANPEVCRTIVASGHSVENHGQFHRKITSLLGPAGWRREVGEAQRVLEEITGQRPQYFRAIAGLRNPFLDPVLRQYGIRLASWTRRGYDTRTDDPDRVLSRLTKNLAAGDILLLHDGHAARTSAGRAVILDVLPRLLAELSVRKLTPVTLPSACNQN